MSTLQLFDEIRIEPLKHISGHFFLTGDYEIALLGITLAALGDKEVVLTGVPHHPAIHHWTRHLKACGWKIEVADTYTISPLEKVPQSFPAFQPIDDIQSCIWGGLVLAFEKTDSLLISSHNPDFLNFLWEPQEEPSIQHPQRAYRVRVSSWSNRHILKAKREPWEKLAYFFSMSRYQGEIRMEAEQFGTPNIEALLPLLGHSLVWDRNLPEAKTELERRMARFQKSAPKEREKLLYTPPFRWTHTKVRLPGDITKASAFALCATLLKKSDITMDNLYLHPQNMAFFGALRKMGADIEVSGKKDEGGIPRGEVRVRPAELMGKRFGWEALSPLLKDIPLLILAAAFGHGETIFRDIEFLRQYPEDMLKKFTETLRQGGVEIGEVPDGLVVRGRREIELSEVDASGSLSLSWAFAVLGICHHQPLIIKNTPLGFQDLYLDWYNLLKPPV